MILGAVHLEGGQIRHAHVLAQNGADRGIIPGSADQDRGVVRELIRTAGADVEGGVHQLLHALDGDQARGAVEGVMHGDEGAVVIGGPLGNASGAEEEGGQIPGRALHLKGEILLGSFAVRDQLLQGVHVLLRDDALVVVHEIAVVRRQGIGVDRVPGGGGGHGTGVVIGPHEFGGARAQLHQGTGLHQAGKLILREAEDVAAGFHVRHHLGRRVRLGNGFHRGVDHDAQLVAGVEGFDLLLCQIHDVLGHPDLHVIGARDAGRAGKGAHAQRHGQGQQQGNKFLHKQSFLSFMPEACINCPSTGQFTTFFPLCPRIFLFLPAKRLLTAPAPQRSGLPWSAPLPPG